MCLLQEGSTVETRLSRVRRRREEKEALAKEREDSFGNFAFA